MDGIKKDFGIKDLGVAFAGTGSRSDEVEKLFSRFAGCHLPGLESEVGEYLFVSDSGEFDAMCQAMAFKYGLSMEGAFFFLMGVHAGRSFVNS